MNESVKDFIGEGWSERWICEEFEGGSEVAMIKLPEALYEKLVLFWQPYLSGELLLRTTQLPTVLQNVIEHGMFLVLWSRGLADNLPDTSKVTIGSRRVWFGS